MPDLSRGRLIVNIALNNMFVADVKRRTNSGFTLIELLVTIAIIAVLMAVGIVAYSGVQKNARDTKRQADLRSIQAAFQQYYADQIYFPQTLGSQVAFGSGDSKKVYLSQVPTDPSVGTAYQYQPYVSVNDYTSACDNSGNLGSKPCKYYCLYAGLENGPGTGSASNCPPLSGYNYAVTPP